MSDLKFVLLFFLGILIGAGAIIGGVFWFTRNEPNVYLYCGSGWSAVCIKSPTKLSDTNGCVSNDQGKICGTYEQKYGQY